MYSVYGSNIDNTLPTFRQEIHLHILFSEQTQVIHSLGYRFTKLTD